MDDWEKRGERMAAALMMRVDTMIAPLLKRIDELEARELPDIDKKLAEAMEGIIDNDDVKAICEQLIGAIPAPVIPDFTASIDEKVTVAVSKLEKPKDGKSVTLDEVAPLIEEAVRKEVDKIPPAKNGIDALVPMIDREGNLVFTMSDGSVKTVGKVVGDHGNDVDMKAVELRVKELFDAWPKPKDGFSLKHFDASMIDEGRTLLLKFADEELAFTCELPMQTMIYRGVFREGQEYKQGDTVTWGGHLYHCDTDTTDKPDGEQRCWTLAVRRGRDGKDNKPLKD